MHDLGLFLSAKKCFFVRSKTWKFSYNLLKKDETRHYEPKKFSNKNWLVVSNIITHFTPKIGEDSHFDEQILFKGVETTSCTTGASNGQERIGSDVAFTKAEKNRWKWKNPYLFTANNRDL